MKKKKSKKWLFIILGIIFFFVLLYFGIYLYARMQPKLPITGANGYHLYDISRAIGTYAGYFGYGVVRELCGHGIGTKLHEDPQIPNFAMPRRGLRLKAGMTLAVEPMINLGTADVKWMRDGWTVVTKDRKPSAHYENTILITEGEPKILTLSEEEGKEET